MYFFRCYIPPINVRNFNCELIDIFFEIEEIQAFIVGASRMQHH